MAKAKKQSRKRSGTSSASAAPAKSGAPDPLAGLRAKIDDVDARIHALLNERAGLARQAGVSKHADGHTVDYYRPEREAQVLRLARERNKGPLRNEEILRLFREIVTGGDGTFHFSAMTPGTYEIAAELAGFRKFVTRDIVLVVGRTTPQTITLEVGAVAETVTVTGESPLVDISSQEIGGTVSAKRSPGLTR